MKKINNIYITSQLNPEDISFLKNKYIIKVIINNRPDEEEVDQPKSESIKKVCSDLGVDYFYQPIKSFSSINDKDKKVFSEIINRYDKDTNILAFCRTGRRSEGLI